MPKEGTRSLAETRFQRVQRTDQEAKSVVEIERDAVRKKTAGLRALRLAKEAEAGITDMDESKNAARKKGRPRAKA